MEDPAKKEERRLAIVRRASEHTALVTVDGAPTEVDARQLVAELEATLRRLLETRSEGALIAEEQQRVRARAQALLEERAALQDKSIALRSFLREFINQPIAGPTPEG